MSRRLEGKNVYAFIAAEASYITGALWLVDSGITVAKGAVGSETPFWSRSEPKGELCLDYSQEGLENKETEMIK